MLISLPIVNSKDEGSVIGGSGIFVRTVANIKSPSEIYQELTSTNAYYSLSEENSIEFKIGIARYSSRLAGKKIILSAELNGLHEKAYICSKVEDDEWMSNFVFLESWMKDIRQETYAIINGKKYESNEDEFNDFLKEIERIKNQ